jgi:hypothetical protein
MKKYCREDTFRASWEKDVEGVICIKTHPILHAIKEDCQDFSARKAFCRDVLRRRKPEKPAAAGQVPGCAKKHKMNRNNLERI